jgi:hypothetical protein
VERGFSLLSHVLGQNRLRTQICSLDCRLRVKQSLPAPFTNVYEATEAEMQFAKVGAEAEAGAECMNAVEVYKQMLLPNGTVPLIKQLHETLSIDKSLVWEQLANKFDAFDQVSMHEPKEGESDSEVCNIREMERLLTVGDRMSVEELERALAGM